MMSAPPIFDVAAIKLGAHTMQPNIIVDLVQFASMSNPFKGFPSLSDEKNSYFYLSIKTLNIGIYI